MPKTLSEPLQLVTLRALNVARCRRGNVSVSISREKENEPPAAVGKLESSAIVDRTADEARGDIAFLAVDLHGRPFLRHPVFAERLGIQFKEEVAYLREYRSIRPGHCSDPHVRADDGNTYVLGHNEETDEWTLESFRSPASPGQYDPHFDPPNNIQ